jgi:hypothetical protein
VIRIQLYNRPTKPVLGDGKAILSNELMYEETKPFIVSNLAEDLVFTRASTGGNAVQHKMARRYKFMFTMNSPLS